MAHHRLDPYRLEWRTQWDSERNSEIAQKRGRNTFNVAVLLAYVVNQGLKMYLATIIQS